MALSDLHLADLHERARELEVPRYRMLTRDELIEAIEEAGAGNRAKRLARHLMKRLAPHHGPARSCGAALAPGGQPRSSLARAAVGNGARPLNPPRRSRPRR